MTDVYGSIARLEQGLAQHGGTASAYYELGGLKLAGGDSDGAIAAYGKCLELAAPNAAVYNNLGTALIKAARFGEAIAALEAALELQPGYRRALVNLGKALREAARPTEAISRLREALTITPDYVPALVNLGDALAATGDLDGAQETLERATRLAPRLVEAHLSLGIVRLQSWRVAESLDALRTAVACAPHHADAHSNLAHALFVAGDWRAAWPHFEYRFQRHARVHLSPPAAVERWDGTLSPDLEIWLIGEQGLGDQLHFVRYAQLVADAGMRCVIACDPRLVQILESAKLGCRTVALGTEPQDRGTRWFPLMSLPGWHGTTSGTVPFAAGYLAADPRRIEQWRVRLPPTKALRVALAWAGNPRMETGRYAGRSPPLRALAPLMNVPEVSFVSLQKGHGEDQLDAVSFGGSILRLPNLDSGTDAFLDTAAVLKCVDLLVTSDTAIAHLAGALGVPTWLCLMHEPDWRWMQGSAVTPWYASMRLFRQSTPSDWAGVYAQVAAALGLEVARRCTSPAAQRNG
jgi:Flp pilus assembly protein TadD